MKTRLFCSPPPLEGGSKLSLSGSEKVISGRGNIEAVPRPEKYLAALEFFDQPSRGGWRVGLERTRSRRSPQYQLPAVDTKRLMGCRNDNSAGAAVLLNKLRRQRFARRIERCQRLVEQPERPPAQFEPRQRGALLLSGGKILCGQVAGSRQTDLCERRRDIAGHAVVARIECERLEWRELR